MDEGIWRMKQNGPTAVKAANGSDVPRSSESRGCGYDLQGPEAIVEVTSGKGVKVKVNAGRETSRSDRMTSGSSSALSIRSSTASSKGSELNKPKSELPCR